MTTAILRSIVGAGRAWIGAALLLAWSACAQPAPALTFAMPVDYAKVVVATDLELYPIGSIVTLRLGVGWDVVIPPPPSVSEGPFTFFSLSGGGVSNLETVEFGIYDWNVPEFSLCRYRVCRTSAEIAVLIQPTTIILVSGGFSITGPHEGGNGFVFVQAPDGVTLTNYAPPTAVPVPMPALLYPALLLALVRWRAPASARCSSRHARTSSDTACSRW